MPCSTADTEPMAASTPDETFHVAIIGAGITGVNLALGLQARNVSFTLYERAPCIRDIGAGIGFSPNAERAMPLLNPDILTAFKRIANPNGEDYFQWVDGFDSGELIFKLHVGKDGFQGGRRSDILEEWGKRVNPSSVVFGKALAAITDPPNPSDKLILHFTDGTTATADAVIGCDGIRSLVRKHVLSPPGATPSSQLPPSAHPRYTRKFCFRALAPMSAALASLGKTKALTRYMYNGPGAHVITYPVANNTLLNILVVISDPSPDWPHPNFTCPGHKSEAVQAFGEWHPTVRAIIDLLPEEMDKWGIFDMAEYPAEYYARGRVCVAGDAAHAAGPHLGAGGGMGVEDALVLAELLDEVNRRIKELRDRERVDKGGLVTRAFGVYNEVRYHRTQDVVRSTRDACDLFEWREPEVGRNPERFGPAISGMFLAVWEFDVEGMVKEAMARLDRDEAWGTFSLLWMGMGHGAVETA